MTSARGPHRVVPVVVVVVAVLAVLAVGGAANAYWRVAGLGGGSGSTATIADVTLTPGTASAGLFPGGTADVALSIENPNSQEVDVRSLALDTSRGTGGFDVDAGHPGCDVSVLGFSPQDNAGDGWSVAGRSGGQDGTLPVTLSGAVAMSSAAANACQGATFTVYLSAGP